jgi:hypothetical protein
MGHGEEQPRRSVVPAPVRTAGGGSPWLPAVWTGLGAAVVCATLAIVAVAACWLPVSGSTGRTNSAIRAGLLTFLASLHGGITVDGVSAAWLPLGMLIIVGVTAWRAGAGLADAVCELGVHDPARLAAVGLAQVLSFTAGCLVTVPFATLGTSRAPFFGVALAAAVLFALTGGVAFARSTPLRDWWAERVPHAVGAPARAGAAAVTVYLASGAVLAAGSLVVHHTAVERLSTSVGGGAGGIPLLVLGILAAPNVTIAAAAYLAGPGFSLGTGTHLSLFGSAHGLLPAFPVLAAAPGGAPNPVVWGLAVLTPMLAGVLVARLSMRVDGWLARFASAGGAAAFAGGLMLVLGWQGGGAAGDGRLHTVGASPWLLGASEAATLAATSGLALALAAGWQALRAVDEDEEEESMFAALRFPRLRVVGSTADAEERDDLAG